MPEGLRVAFETARLHLSRLRVGGDQASLPALIAAAVEVVARTVKVARVGVWLFEDGHSRLRCVWLHAPGGSDSPADHVLRLVDVPTYCSALEERRTIAAHDACNDPATHELADLYLRPHGIGSLLDAPVYRRGEVIGVVCHEHVGPPRRWTQEECEFAGAVADMIGLAFEQAEAAQARAAQHSAEERVLQERRLAELGRVAAAVGAEVSARLGEAEGALDTLEARGDLPADARAHLATLRGALAGAITRCRSAMDLAPDDLTDAESGGLGADVAPPAVRAELDDAVAGALLHLRSLAPDRDLAVVAGAPGVSVALAPERVRDLLAELVANAADATSPGARIRLGTSLAQEADGRAVAVLAVEDDGEGMSDRQRAQASVPGYTTRAGRAGLGLARVRRLAALAGGRVVIESAVGRGTRVALRLPTA